MVTFAAYCETIQTVKSCNLRQIFIASSVGNTYWYLLSALFLFPEIVAFAAFSAFAKKLLLRIICATDCEIVAHKILMLCWNISHGVSTN